MYTFDCFASLSVSILMLLLLFYSMVYAVRHIGMRKYNTLSSNLSYNSDYLSVCLRIEHKYGRMAILYAFLANNIDVPLVTHNNLFDSIQKDGKKNNNIKR
jgi:hypothetical protein